MSMQQGNRQTVEEVWNAVIGGVNKMFETGPETGIRLRESMELYT